jgi:hypothetical protein
MAYQENTTAASPADLINVIATFAAANGWTVERNNLAGSNRTVTLKRAETDYIHLYNTATSALSVLGSVSYNSAVQPPSETLRGNPASCNVLTGPYTRTYLFADDSPAPHIHAVIEITAGVFRTLSFGLLEKAGVYTGGTYYDATTWENTNSNSQTWNTTSHACFESNTLNGSLRVDIPADSRSNAWTGLADFTLFNGLGSAISNSTENPPRGFLTTLAYNRNLAPFSGNTILAPIANYVNRVGGLRSPVGVFPNVRYLRMDRYIPGEEISIGGDTWKVFPFVRQGNGPGGSGLAPYSAQHAYAFKKVT